MNKRDFLIQGGGALLAGTALKLAQAAEHQAPSDGQVHQPGTQAWWCALQGERFGSHTTLGRAVALDLSKVTSRAHGGGDTETDQFSVSFSGPRNLPLQAGMHTLQHPRVGALTLYLEPLHQGTHIHYAAHFSLLT